MVDPFNCYCAVFAELALLVFATILTFSGIFEVHKSRTYIKNFCQVIQSDTEELDCNDNGSDCDYRPVWTVMYDRPNDNDEPIQAVINSSQLETKSEADAVKKQMEYKVDQIYTCYHNPHKHIVQWKQPSKLRGSLLIAGGGFCLLTAVIAVWVWLRNRGGCCSKRSDDDPVTFTADEEWKRPLDTTEVNERLNPVDNA
ncbi:unnamed protein product [Didymodactylos carnosus]|uniref:Uncharacterized protein n=1 Tax=Didymodactylos carnosus TaxID=1234261 RepID=A0A815IQ45_9BILA|nr:unnamed protein product [Didymodactylos carnosus]CAF1368776.1 unnamed protein product [Didymodactylos carnosus]CAF3839744.1 unnamed protein product [Didymodactylos carnosus]CAF4253372.1 unnamed protein product [Didymodactylos carnosus]